MKVQKVIKADETYINLIKDVLDYGTQKSDRTGTGTISLFSSEIRFKMSDGFPLLTTKKMFTKGIIYELLWFLNGETNIKSLIENGVNIWNGDAYKAYAHYHNNHPTIHSNRFEILSLDEFVEQIKTDDSFAKKWGDLGPVYGKQWRRWGGSKKVPVAWDHGTPTHFDEEYVDDQISQLIHQLNTDPDSRRLIVSAWNVSELDQMVLPPCHFEFQMYTKELTHDEKVNWVLTNCYETGMERFYVNQMTDEDFHGEYFNCPKRSISLKWTQRSVDTFLGLPFNIASYAFLLHMIAQQVNMVPDLLIGSLGDVHIYNNHIDQVKEQIDREPRALPNLILNKAKSLFDYKLEDFEIINYDPHPPIKGKLSN